MAHPDRNALEAVHLTGPTMGSSSKHPPVSGRHRMKEGGRSQLQFDAVVDFNKVMLDPASGEMRPEFVPDNTIGGPGDKLHPNRAGYRAMANSIDLGLLAP